MKQVETTSTLAPAAVDWTGWSLALAATFASAIVTPMARGAVQAGMNPITLVLTRLLIASLLLVGWMAIFDRERFKLARSGWWHVGVIGLLSGIEICCFFWSLTYVDASMSAMLKATQPLIVLLLLASGGERLTSRHWLRLALALLGAYLLIGPGGRVAPMGLLLLGLSLLLYGLSIVLMQWWLQGYDSRTATLYVTLVMTVVIVIWWWLQDIGWQTPDRQGWIVIWVLAIVSTFFARLALFSAIRRIGSGQIALLWPLQTLSVIVLSVIFLGERLTTIQWLGGALILLSAVLVAEKRTVAPSPPLENAAKP